MSVQSVRKWALVLLVFLISSAVHAETYYLDSNQNTARPHYRTSQEACVTGEIESRIQGYRASETNSSVKYRVSALQVSGDDGLGEYECVADIERTYANVWVTLELVDVFVYGPFGGADACNISGYSDSETGQCGSPKCTAGAANCCTSCNGTNPIHTASGNKYQRETDYVGMGPYPLRFDRAYSHNTIVANLPVPMGIGWSHTYSSHLTAYPSTPGGSIDRVRAYRADGRMLTFSLSGSTWQADADVSERLVATTSGWQLTTPADDVESYDNEGRLISITSLGGFTQTLSYITAANHPANPVQKVTDSQGRSLTFGYDTSGRLSTLTDGLGQVITYTYDSANNLATAVYPTTGSGTVTRAYYYNETGQTSGASQPNALTGLVDENTARYASWGYTSAGRANLSVHGAFTGGTVDRTALLFNSNGTTTVTDALGQARTFGFSVTLGVARQAGLDTTCRYCGEPPKAQTYDANGFPATATDFNSHATNFTFDARGLEDQRVEAVGLSEQRTVATTWNSAFHVPVLRTVANGQGATTTKTVWVDNTRGQPLARCDIDPAQAGSYTCAATGTPPAGVRRWIYTYCDTVNGTQCPEVGLLLSVTGPRTDVTSLTQYSYYLASDASGCGVAGGSCHQAGDLYQVTDALGHVMTYVAYDKNGRVVRQKDANGVITDLTYHPRGWLLSRMVRANADGSASANDAVTQVGYDAVGNVTKITDPDGVFVSYTYDTAHRLTDITDALGNHIHYTLDALGNKTQEQTFDTSSTVRRSLSRTFSTLDQLTKVTDGLSHAVFNASYSDSYDGNNNLVHSVDALSVQRKLGYDGLNRLVSTIDNYNGTDTPTQNTQSVFAYDERDNLDGVSDPTSLSTTYDYDGLSNAKAVHSPDTGSTTLLYDAAGNPIQRTDAKSVVSTLTYDALNRRTAMTYIDTTLNASYTYDESNSVTGCSSSYPVGRLTRVIENAVTTVYCYDLRGNVIRKQQTQGTQADATSYSYTLADRLSTIVNPSQTATQYGRDADGRISAVTVTPSGGSGQTAVSAVSYLPFGPIAGYTLGNGQTLTRTYDANYAFTDIVSPAFNLHLARDAMGDITALGASPGANPATENYIYDPLYRLTGVNNASGGTVEAYTYNKTGDRLSKTSSGLATGAYSYQSGTHWLTSIGNAARTYDANGNTTGSVVGGNTYGFGYNGRNRMTVAQLNGSTVGTYTYNALGQRVAKSATFPQTLNVRYVYDENSRLLGEYGTSTRDYVWLDNLPVAVVDTQGTISTVNYVYADGLNTPRAVANSTGVAQWQFAYQSNPLGEQQPTSATGYSLNLRFPGQYYDAESGLAYNVNRDFEAATGRYVQSDPIGLGGGMSTYGYVGGGPLDSYDLLGLACPTALKSTGKCVDATNYNSDTDGDKTVQGDDGSDAAFLQNMYQLDTSTTDENYGDIHLDNSFGRVQGSGESTSKGYVGHLHWAPSEVAKLKAICHSHPNNKYYGPYPGFGDDGYVNQGFPNYIVQNGFAGVLEQVNGQFQYRALKGRLDDKQRKAAQSAVNGFQHPGATP
ncbi:RHS repeat-associated core domain-containing protein [Dyella sp. Tek66A03]|uniref:RHS repeat-associated core domain-containing protein n=1 Tax=Dyella sp. Tek66A03 TaxID=3458298 RepID=UPI00403EC530